MSVYFPSYCTVDLTASCQSPAGSELSQEVGFCLVLWGWVETVTEHYVTHQLKEMRSFLCGTTCSSARHQVGKSFHLLLSSASAWLQVREPEEVCWRAKTKQGGWMLATFSVHKSSFSNKFNQFIKWFKHGWKLSCAVQNTKSEKFRSFLLFEKPPERWYNLLKVCPVVQMRSSDWPTCSGLFHWTKASWICRWLAQQPC